MRRREGKVRSSDDRMPQGVRGKEGGRVQVLLSTYNGARYLESQMESLLAQDYPDLEILVRDDGSTDRTPALLAKYAELEQVTVVLGENQGFVGSFFNLLASASSRADYFAFCDQDDVWARDKVSRAVAQLAAEQGRPAMYCGRVELVDEDLAPIALKALPGRGPAFPSALVQNIATGCTIVLNARGRELLVGRFPAFTPSHDWWFYLVLSALGKVIYDPQPKMLYRQHGGNVVGHKVKFWDKVVKRLRGGGMRRHTATRQARELERLFGGQIPAGNKALLDRFLAERGLAGRLRYALSGEVYGQSPKDDLKLKLLIALNYL